MNKQILGELVAERLDVGYRDGYAAVSALLDVLEELLKDGQAVPLSGIGVLEPVRRAPRVAHNPKTLEKVTVPERAALRFRASPKLLREMNAQAPEGGAR